MTYTDLTEEYDALDEELSRTVPIFGLTGIDWLIQQALRQLGLAKVSTDYLLTRAAAPVKVPFKSLTRWYWKSGYYRDQTHYVSYQTI